MPAADIKQMRQLTYWTNWSAAPPASVEAAIVITGLLPADIQRVFFLNFGSETVESAIKFARQYFVGQGQPEPTNIISREISNHSTTLGALAITGIPKFKAPPDRC